LQEEEGEKKRVALSKSKPIIIIMDLSEAFVWPLSFTTNCYTGARRQRRRSKSTDDNRVDNDKSGDDHVNHQTMPKPSSPQHSIDDNDDEKLSHQVSLATEQHILCLDFPENRHGPLLSVRSSASDWSTTPHRGPSSPSSNHKPSSNDGFGTTKDQKDHSLTHVGYSSCGSWEALALLNPMSDNTTDNNAPKIDVEGGEHSISLSPEVIAALSDNPPQQNSSGGGIESATASVTSKDSSKLVAPSSSSSVTTKPAQTVNVPSTAQSKQTVGNSSSKPKQTHAIDQPAIVTASLVLRTCGNNKHICHQVSLKFRPLAVTLGEINFLPDHGQDSEQEQSQMISPVVWCGSADTSNLYCFTLCEKDGDETEKLEMQNDPLAKTSLRPLALPMVGGADADTDNTPFQFTSPVMAIDYITFLTKTNNQTTSCLGVACQDGMVQLNLFTSVRQSHGLGTQWNDLTTHSIVIDGPLVTIHLSYNETTGQLVALIGSLFGYVIKLSCSPTKDSGFSWGKPQMVVDSLWNSHLMCEDMVLALYALVENEIVIVGTYSGRCYIYQACKTTEETHKKRRPYRCVWKCRLPYSIHGICAWWSKFEDGPSSLEDSVKSPNLVITTRRSVHLFQQNQRRGDTTQSSATELSDAKLAKERIAKLCQLQLSH